MEIENAKDLLILSLVTLAFAIPTISWIAIVGSEGLDLLIFTVYLVYLQKNLRLKLRLQ